MVKTPSCGGDAEQGGVGGGGGVQFPTFCCNVCPSRILLLNPEAEMAIKIQFLPAAL